MNVATSRTAIVSAFLMLSVGSVDAQDWSVNLIPDSLKDGSHNSVVRLYDVEFSEKADIEGVAHFHRVVTVLNNRGDKFADWVTSTDDNMKGLGDFGGKLYDANGKLIRKIKKSEIKTSRYSQYIATSSQMNYMEAPTVTSYPYTIEYEWDERFFGGLLSYPTIDPMDGEGQSMQGATYTLKVKAGTEIAYREMMTSAQCSKTTEGDADVYRWTLPAHRAIVSDVLESSALYRYPKVLAHPLAFSYGKYAGRLDSWSTLGKWSYELARGRDVLPPAEVEKVHNLTDHLNTKREKVKALYNYLGQKTRYVAILLGIGGWQPMKAEEVSKTGFGDCKALSNFMLSMLKEVGIESYLTDISTKYERLLPDFPNFMQLDHVILCVPDADTLWIDCTAADYLPFGSVPSSLRGNDCILLKENRGEMARIPAMTAEENTYRLKVEITLDEDMGVKSAHYSSDLYGCFFQKYLTLVQKDEKSKSNAMNDILNLGNSKLSNIRVESVADDKPCLHAECDFLASYGKKNGARLFMPANPFTSLRKPKFNAGRTTPIVVNMPVTYSDEIIVNLPANVNIEGMPEFTSLESEFGSFQGSITFSKDNVLYVKQETVIRSGEFPISKKELFAEFYEKIGKMLSSMVVLTKVAE